MTKNLMMIMCLIFVFGSEAECAVSCMCAYAVCIYIDDKIDGLKI